jgi:glycosyltransferase involved in cell wall biosynthesis
MGLSVSGQPVARIVCVTHYFPSRRGGIEAVALEINSRLAARGIQVDWFASATVLPAPVPGIRYRTMQAIEVVERLTGIPLPIWLGRGIPALWNAIRDCDAVHVHDFIYPGSLLALLMGRWCNKTVVMTQHIGDIPYRSRTLSCLLTAMNHLVGRPALRAATRVVFISHAVQAYFHSFVRFRMAPHYMPNGVDPAVFYPVAEHERQQIRSRLGLAPGTCACLFVGRFVEKKGMALLAQLVGRTVGIQWLFAGAGPLHPEAWQADNVRVFEGYQREQLADLYRAADLLILPSRGEGFPLVVQEAFACGTPALVSDETAAGCETAVPLLYKLPVQGADVLDLWQAALHAFSDDPALLSARRPAVAEFARREWDWERAVNLYAELYERDSALANRT